jgi:hypothetical protein
MDWCCYYAFYFNYITTVKRNTKIQSLAIIITQYKYIHVLRLLVIVTTQQLSCGNGNLCKLTVKEDLSEVFNMFAGVFPRLLAIKNASSRSGD